MKKSLNKARDKKDRFLGRVDGLLHRLSRSNSPEPPAFVSENDPAPSVSAPELPSDPSSIFVPPANLAGVAPTSAPRPTIGIPVATPSESTLSGPSPSTFGNHPVPALIVSAPSISGSAAANTTWDGLKVLGGVLKGWGDTFGPLKSAVEDISECVEIYEVRIQVRFILSLCI
jgi:hypothetical protein